MGTWGRAVAVGLCVSSLPFGQLDPMRGGEPPPVEQLTTGTPEFCRHLASRVMAAERDHPPPPRPVIALAGEGQMMCDRGEIRRGVHRLRRAMRLLLEGGSDDWHESGGGAAVTPIIDLPPAGTRRH